MSSSAFDLDGYPSVAYLNAYLTRYIITEDSKAVAHYLTMREMLADGRISCKKRKTADGKTVPILAVNLEDEPHAYADLHYGIDIRIKDDIHAKLKRLGIRSEETLTPMQWAIAIRNLDIFVQLFNSIFSTENFLLIKLENTASAAAAAAPADHKEPTMDEARISIMQCLLLNDMNAIKGKLPRTNILYFIYTLFKDNKFLMQKVCGRDAKLVENAVNSGLKITDYHSPYSLTVFLKRIDLLSQILTKMIACKLIPKVKFLNAAAPASAAASTEGLFANRPAAAAPPSTEAASTAATAGTAAAPAAAPPKRKRSLSQSFSA